jgi:hypothetical protein
MCHLVKMGELRHQVTGKPPDESHLGIISEECIS